MSRPSPADPHAPDDPPTDDPSAGRLPADPAPARPLPAPPVPSGPIRRAVVVHERAHVEAALAEAVGLRLPVALLTAPGAADYGGPGYLLAMIARSAARHPDADVVAMIDCADAAGRVFAALDAGWKHIVFTGEPALAARLADAAGQVGATLLTVRPDALDLARDPAPRPAVRAWLKMGVR